ncbi:MAG: hypothetical protein JWO91_1021 [Acidobacteriaceae bacterium]|nr:hypothetical protein [Acidobacteriaceae bacterium]
MSCAAPSRLRYLSSVPLLTLLVVSSYAQQSPSVNSILRVELDSPAKVKHGAPVHAHTVEPLYNADTLIVPAGTIVTGKIISVTPVTKGKRADAMSHGDFTPLHESQIKFETIKAVNGNSIAIEAAPAQQSSAVVRFQRSNSKHPSIFRRLWASAADQKNQTLNSITGPGKVDRLKKYAFSQLPWHPETIDAGVQYDITLQAPLVIPQNAAMLKPNTSESASDPKKLSTTKEPEKLNHSAVLHARLADELSSKTAKQNDAVVAVVTQPLLDRQGQVEIPQGALLKGRVLRAHPAKGWGKNGALRFTFNQVDFPQGTQQQVSGVPTAVDGSRNQSLKLDSEGGVEPDTNKGLMMPLALGLIAASTFTDEDAGVAKIGVSSNGFGLITRVIAVATGSKTVGGVIGLMGAGRMVYSRFLAHGRDVVFQRNSPVEVEVGPIHKLSTPVTSSPSHLPHS